MKNDELLFNGIEHGNSELLFTELQFKQYFFNVFSSQSVIGLLKILIFVNGDCKNTVWLDDSVELLASMKRMLGWQNSIISG